MIHTTPAQLTLEEGKYEIDFPPTCENKGVFYNFWSWENGDKNPTRIVSLSSDTNIKATYRPIAFMLDKKIFILDNKSEASEKERSDLGFISAEQLAKDLGVV